MDDLLKSFGCAAGAGAGFGIAALAYKVYHDDRLTWLVVGGGVLTAVILATGLTMVLYRHAVESRRLAIEANLTAARVVRTLGVSMEQPRQLPAGGGAGDFLASLLAGAAPQDIVDVPVRYTDNDDHDGGRDS